MPKCKVCGKELSKHDDNQMQICLNDAGVYMEYDLAGALATAYDRGLIKKFSQPGSDKNSAKITFHDGHEVQAANAARAIFEVVLETGKKEQPEPEDDPKPSISEKLFGSKPEDAERESTPPSLEEE